MCRRQQRGPLLVSPDVLGLLPASVSQTAANLPTSPLTVSSYVQTKFDAPGSDSSSFTSPRAAREPSLLR